MGHHGVDLSFVDNFVRYSDGWWAVQWVHRNFLLYGEPKIVYGVMAHPVIVEQVVNKYLA